MSTATALPAALSAPTRGLVVETVSGRSALAGFRGSGRLRWRRSGDLLELAHPYGLRDISDSVVVGELTALVSAGAIAGQEEFEAAAVELITGCTADSDEAWVAFYRNSVRELRDGSVPFSPIHRRARDLLVGESVLEVGSCFGFFALQCAGDGFAVTATDICQGALDLLGRASSSLNLPVTTVPGDVRRLPFTDDSFDTVTILHLLEHLPAADVGTAIAECCRVARSRVVVAVPYEDEVCPHFGHLELLREADLRQWAQAVGEHRTTIFADHGGWLVIDL